MDIAGEAVEDRFEVILGKLLPFFNVCSKLIMISRVLAPACDCEPKLTFRAITVGRSSRSERLLSDGTVRLSTLGSGRGGGISNTDR